MRSARPLVLALCSMLCLAAGVVVAPPAQADDCGVSLINIKHNQRYSNYFHGPTWEVIGLSRATSKGPLFCHKLGTTSAVVGRVLIFV
jgi:hypothetical protein